MKALTAVKPYRKEIIAYLLIALLSLLILIAVMQLWRADLRIPFTYYGEAMFNGLLVKGLMDHSWHLDNPSLGAPDGLNLRDVPMSDNNFHLLFVKLLTLLTNDYALAINLFFILTFPLVALAAFFVFRQFHLSYFSAALGSLLYTFLPFHLTRGQHHLFLSAYYLVPLTLLVALWISSGKLSLFDAETGKLNLNRRNRKLIGGLVVCLIVSAAGAYYAAFACFFLLMAGGIAAIRRFEFRPLLLPVGLIAVILASLFINLLPSTLYLRDNGETQIVRRAAVDAETYGLRISQLLVPASGHRLFLFNKLKSAFNQRLFINENDDASLGLIGVLGFVCLLVWLFYQKLKGSLIHERESLLLTDLSLFNLSAVLLATIGGFGALIALVVSAKIRAYNRISIFIAFLSFFAVGLFIDLVHRHWVTNRRRQMVFAAALLVFLSFGIFDQTTTRAVPNYDQVETIYRNDADFVGEIENRLSAGSMIFQLPVVPFPEHPKVHRMFDYDHARGYLHSKDLRWSYGAIQSREAEVWQKMIAAKPASEMIETLAAAGFNGIYLDRFGYQDNGSQLEKSVSDVLGTQPLISRDGRLVFFDLGEYSRKLRDQMTEEQWQAKQDAARHPIIVVWRNGCSELEGNSENSWRWCSAIGELQLFNGSKREQQAVLEMSFAAENEANLWINSELFSDQLKISPTAKAYSRSLKLPTGKHTFTFTSDARRVLAPGDFRYLVFRIINFKLSVPEAKPAAVESKAVAASAK